MKRLLVLAGLAALSLSACSTSQKASAYSTPGRSTAPSYADASGKTGETTPPDKGADRMVNFTADVRLDTKERDTTMTRLVATAKKYGGYVQSMNGDECSIRVRSENFIPALNDVATFGKVVDKNIHSVDMTDDYNDLKIRLENAEKSRQRYMELLASAHTIDEILRVEREIDRLTLEVEQYKGKLAMMDDQVYYSTITVNIHEKTKPGLVSYAFIGLYKGVKWLFVRG